MRFTCLCCAIPQKLIKHLADRSEGDDRQALLEQIEHSHEVRTQRAALAAKLPPKAKGERPLHRKVFSAKGQTMLPGQLLRDEGAPASHDADANGVYDNIGIALQFFKTVLGRDSVDGEGMRIDASVHYGFRFANAMWTGQQMIVGDGDGKHIAGLSKSLGLIAHELCHGVSQHAVKGGLGVVMEPGKPPRLAGEAGALNESFSDVFASMIKQWHAKQDAAHADWLLGEDVLTPGSGHAVRSLADPGNTRLTWKEDDQIKRWSEYKPGDETHKASGIANHAFYLAATHLGGHSWEQLGSLWLEAYGRLHPKATFKDAARATLDVAGARHAPGAAAHAALQSAWKEVGVTP